MKAYIIHTTIGEIGKTKTGRPKKGYVRKRDELGLDRLVKFTDFDITDLKQLQADLEELGEAVSTILLSDPDKYRDYFQRRVDSINESNRFYSDLNKKEIVLE